MAVSGSTVTSSKDMERLLLMAVHPLMMFIIIMEVEDQAGELLFTSQRTRPSLTSGEYSQTQILATLLCDHLSKTTT